jgi:plastocyanin
MESFPIRRLGAFVPLFVLLGLIWASPGAAAVSAATSSATIYATDASGWHNANVAITVGGTVTWENRDTNNSHPVECVQHDSNAPCPWSNAKDLPPAQSSITGTTPSRASQTFASSGTFAFRCVVHPSTMTGTIVVGSGKPPATKATPTATSTARAQTSARASARPAGSTSAIPTAKTSAAASTKATAKRGAHPRTSVLAAGPKTDPTASSGKGVGAAAIPALLLIAFVAAGHVARRRFSARA